jgi:hypothetical protein
MTNIIRKPDMVARGFFITADMVARGFSITGPFR